MRLIDWEDRLSAFLAEWADTEFAYGTADCAKFAAKAAEAQTGIDLYAPWEGKYDNSVTAAAALRKLGAGTLKKTFDKHFEKRKPAFAQRGDIVFDGKAVGICIGADALFLGQEGDVQGLVRKPRTEWTRAWAV